MHDDGLQVLQHAISELWDQALCAQKLVCHYADVSGVQGVHPASISPILTAMESGYFSFFGQSRQQT